MSPRVGFTIVDETHDFFKVADIKMLERLSTVLAFPTEQEQVRGALAA